MSITLSSFTDLDVIGLEHVLEISTSASESLPWQEVNHGSLSNLSNDDHPQYRDRSFHLGTQPISTVESLQDTLDNKVNKADLINTKETYTFISEHYQEVFNIPEYRVGYGEIEVFIQGLYQPIALSWVEHSNTSIKFLSPLIGGTSIVIKKNKTIGNNTLMFLGATAQAVDSALLGGKPPNLYLNSEIPLATQSNNGLMSSTDKFQLDNVFISIGNNAQFSLWNKSDGISITESQISDLQPYLLEEVDPIFVSSPANGITEQDVTNLSNLSGTNTGDQDLSGLMGKLIYDPNNKGSDCFNASNLSGIIDCGSF